MFSHLETLLVIVVIPTVVTIVALTTAKEMWDISGWASLGVGIGGWLLGFVIGALGSTVVHEVFGESSDDDS